MKKFLLVIAVIVGLLFAGVAYVYVNIDGFTKTLIEKVGSEQLGVNVGIASLNLDLVQKSAGLSGLSIGNPATFSSKDALTVSSISTTLGKIGSDLVTIKEITVGDINVLLEVANGTTNLQTIQGNLPKAKQAPADQQAAAAVPKVIIEKVKIGTTSLEPKFSGGLAEAVGDIGTISVPGFTLTNVGTAENGVTPAEAVRQIMSQYLGKVEKQGIEGQLLQKLPAEFRDLKGNIEGKAQQLQEDIQTKANEAVDSKAKEVRDELDKKIGGALDDVFGR